MIAQTSLPALIALFIKFVLLAYALKSPARNHDTKLYFVLLAVLALHSITEVVILSYYANYGLDATLAGWGYAYFATYIPFIALILHLSLRLSHGPAVIGHRALYLLYLPVIPLELLLLFSDQLVAGFEPFQFSIIRAPGAWYFLLETYVVVYLVAALANLVYGARGARQPVLQRTRTRLWLVALTPMAGLMIYLFVAHHFGVMRLTSTFYVPITASFFLLVATYATHQYRLFDIEFYIPGSPLRRRKTAFYDRIRALIAEIADLMSPHEAVKRLADTLGCPVALVAGNRVLARAGGAAQLAEIPAETLRRIEQIAVANEIRDANPVLHRIMHDHGAAAIVPFRAHSPHAAGWLLLGASFSEQVYSRLDFVVVEKLFDRMADLFLGQLLAMRTQLAEATETIHELETFRAEIEVRLEQLDADNRALRAENAALRRARPADSLMATATDAAQFHTGAVLTLLGRDKTLFKLLRAEFPHLNQFVGADSASFQRQPPADVLICQVDTASPRQLLGSLLRQRGHGAALLVGAAAREFVAAHRKELLGMLVDVLPGLPPATVLLRRLQALLALRRSLHAVTDPDQPLIGASPALNRALHDARRLASFVEPVTIESSDRGQAVAFARYLHDASGATGRLRVLTVSGPGALPVAIDSNDTLAITGLYDGVAEVAGKLGGARLILLRDGGQEPPANDAQTLVLQVPELGSRAEDLPALVHYFTLQYNLQADSGAYLSEGELDALRSEEAPADVAGLKHAVFARLAAKQARSAVVAAPLSPIGDSGPERSLDEHVAEFEARIIEQTLRRCGGNKSQTARLLGLRPNTLHYKLERYGIGAERRDGDD